MAVAAVKCERRRCPHPGEYLVVRGQNQPWFMCPQHASRPPRRRRRPARHPADRPQRPRWWRLFRMMPLACALGDI